MSWDPHIGKSDIIGTWCTYQNFIEEAHNSISSHKVSSWYIEMYRPVLIIKSTKEICSSLSLQGTLK